MGGTEKAKGVSAKGRGTDVAMGAVKVCRITDPPVCLYAHLSCVLGGVCICVWELWVYWDSAGRCSVVQHAERVEAASVHGWKRTGRNWYRD